MNEERIKEFYIRNYISNFLAKIVYNMKGKNKEKI